MPMRRGKNLTEQTSSMTAATSTSCGLPAIVRPLLTCGASTLNATIRMPAVNVSVAVAVVVVAEAFTGTIQTRHHRSANDLENIPLLV